MSTEVLANVAGCKLAASKECKDDFYSSWLVSVDKAACLDVADAQVGAPLQKKGYTRANRHGKLESKGWL